MSLIHYLFYYILSFMHFYDHLLCTLIGLPTVLSVTMAVGAKQLAAKKVIVKRLTAVEEMASISVLCSDKTGTLTLNELTFDEPYLCPGYSKSDILLYAYLSAEPGANDPIESAVR